MTEDKQSVVALAKERFERAKTSYATSRVLAVEDTRFVMGDSDNGWQWPDEMREVRRASQRACLTVNTTAQHCNQIINNIRQNRPQCRILPVDNHADKRTADILAGLIRNIQSTSNADDAHDVAAEHSIYGGEGYWRVVTEYETPYSFKQVIRIKTISNPMLVYIDPDCQNLDKSDADWGFVFEDIGKEQAKRDHPDLDPSSWGNSVDGWVQKDTIRRAEYFYCEHVADTAVLLRDGSEGWLSQFQGDPLLIAEKRPAQRKAWKWCKLVGGADDPIDVRDWPGQYLPIISVVGKEVNVNGEIVRKGVVRDLKDPARMVNYSYSAAVETIALQNKIPYMASAEAIEGYEEIWASANNENRAYLPYNAYDEAGNALPKPERQQPAVMPTAQVQMLQLSTEQMRAASGQQNANFGIKSEAASGVGIQRLKAQGEVATFHFPDNQVRGLKYEAKILLDLIPKIYDTRRIVRILGLDGKEDQALLDPEAQQAYMETGRKVENEVNKIFNPTMGMYDVQIDTGPSYATQRQEAFAALTELAGRNPQLMQLAGDIVMRAADFPLAQELADRLEKTVPPELLDDEQKGDIPPQVQAQMQAMTQQIEQMGQALQQAQAQLDSKDQETQIKAGELQLKQQELSIKEQELALKSQDGQIKAYDAETKRIQAEQSMMQPAPMPTEPSQPAAPAAPIIIDTAQQMADQLAPMLEAIALGQQQTNEAMLMIATKLSEPPAPRDPVAVRVVRRPDGSLEGVAG